MKAHPIGVSEVRDAILIAIGSMLFAVGVDCFQVPNGLAAGGITGLATIINAVGLRMGLTIPIGLQGLVANVLLLIPVIKTGSHRYLAYTLAGIFFSNVFVDVLAPILPTFTGDDMLLYAIWGGVISGIGLGMVFRTGGNTGGTDIVAQLLARGGAVSVGMATAVVDGAVIALSIPVFSFSNALYALICMFVSAKVLDAVVDGPSTERMAYVISNRHERIAELVMYEMGRGCTELQARGVWSGNNRPVLLIVLTRSELGQLKDIASRVDPDALVVISEVHEAFGQGFGRLGE